MAQSAFDLLADPDPGAWRRFYAWWNQEPEPTGSLREAVPFLAINRWPETGRQEDGKPLVCVEEQGVYLWAVDGAPDADPPVIGRYNGTSDPWRVQAPRLSLFCAQLLVIDAAFSEHGAGTGGAIRDGPRALAGLDPLPWPPWDWPPPAARFYAGADAVALACDDDGWWSVWVGAREDSVRERWSWMEEI